MVNLIIFVLVIYCPHSQPKPEEIYQNHKKYVKKRKILCMHISGEIWCNKMHICKILYSTYIALELQCYFVRRGIIIMWSSFKITL